MKPQPNTIQFIAPELNPAQLKQLEHLLLDEVVGKMEQRETSDMTLKSWSDDDYKAFGRNELRGKQASRLHALLFGEEL